MRTKKTWPPVKFRWVAQPYRDHANQPATLLVNKIIANTEEIKEAVKDFEAIPEFAMQVYSTLPLDSDHTALCISVERSIPGHPCHLKSTAPSRMYSPAWSIKDERLPTERPQYQERGVPSCNHLPQIPRRFSCPRLRYEDDSGFLWVNFNRSFPLKTKVDEHSRFLVVPDAGYIPSEVEKSDICPEMEEIKVRKCRNKYEPLRELHLVLRRSDINADGYDYGLDDDEGDPDSLNQLPAPETIVSWALMANSYSYNNFSVQSPTEGAVLIRSKVKNIEPDLQYIMHVSFAHTSSQLLLIAQVFTAAVIENLPHRKTINFEFHSASSQSLNAILASHRKVMNAQPDIAMGVYKHESQIRNFPQHRGEDYSESGLRFREPYQTFFIIVDRPDFLTAPGVLFFLADSNGHWPYQVWRSAGMPEVARRLAMLGLEQ